MTGWDASTYGERIADLYDTMAFRELAPASDTVAFLTELAGPGPVLELGVGTGRIALPLAEEGVRVQGIDASPAMVARMRAKPGGDGIPVTIGDFADVGVEGAFSLVFVVFNTFFALVTQDDQVRCFANVAAHLDAGGAFVIEAFVPDLARFDRDQRVGVVDLTVDTVHLDASRHDLATQRVSSRHVMLSEQATRIVPVELRYAWPSELDLMARLGGLRLRQRFGGWHKEPFDSSSPRHVSVYEKE